MAAIRPALSEGTLSLVRATLDAIFQRQVIAYAREGDALLTLSTSGSSENVIAALAEARRRRVLTIAMVGYDGGGSPRRGWRPTS